MQTVYDTQTKCLTQLGGQLTDGLDIEFLGSHSVFEGILDDFVKGDIVRSTLQLRESYMGQKVIDMSKIRMDFARNEINAGTLKILDREFFNQQKGTNETNARLRQEENKDEVQPNFG